LRLTDTLVVHNTFRSVVDGTVYRLDPKTDGRPDPRPTVRDDVPILGDLKALPRVLGTYQIDELILADSEFSEQELLETVEHAHRRGVKVRIAPKTTELLIQRADYVPGQSVPLSEVRSPVFAGSEWLLKRTFDLSVSFLVLVIGLPLWLLIAFAVTLTTPGPILFRDRRVGLGENEFDMLKFRTMYADAAEHQAFLEQANEALLNNPANRETRQRSQFLNGLIVHKSFSWTSAFSDLEKIMPTRVHLLKIEPELTPDNQLKIKMTVAGNSRDKALDLVRKLETSHEFKQAAIDKETTKTGSAGGDPLGSVEFDISAVYVPPTVKSKTFAGKELGKGD